MAVKSTMNIFYVDKDARLAAQALVDKHIVKMILETAQLLSTAHRLLDGQLTHYVCPKTGKTKKHWELYDGREAVLYKASHINHPSSIWTRTAVENYNWLVDHLFALGEEYTHRYGKKHVTIGKLGLLIQSPPYNLRAWDWTPMPSCMDKQYIISDDPIINYRNYYKYGKERMHRWKNRQPPEWIL